jgi:hypothetical protein
MSFHIVDSIKNMIDSFGIFHVSKAANNDEALTILEIFLRVYFN